MLSELQLSIATDILGKFSGTGLSKIGRSGTSCAGFMSGMAENLSGIQIMLYSTRNTKRDRFIPLGCIYFVRGERGLSLSFNTCDDTCDDSDDCDDCCMSSSMSGSGGK